MSSLDEMLRQAEANTPRTAPIPALRMFEVVRHNPLYDYSTGDGSQSIERFTVTAHVAMAVDQQGTMWGFADYVNDPIMGPVQKLHTVRSGVIDITERSNPNTSPLAI